MISYISIRNFRSIAAAELAGNWITTLVGANDAGKSNVLRALNLFFNGQTNPGEAFDFSRDFNQFASTPKGKAPQIEIMIKFDLPEGYRRPELPKTVEWKKVWRREGEVKRMEVRGFIDGRDFPTRSKISALMDRLNFTYIPAIKDKAFFADLQGRLYDVLSSVAEEPLKQSASAFQSQLASQLAGLLANLQSAFGIASTMKLPENLREIFESLEISSGEVPLSRRGDGIKIRHIPMILKFIAVKKDELLTRGGVRYTHIWGFEEPENNVEMSSAFQMAGEFLDVVSDKRHSQIFFTTHSPIFYRLDQHRPTSASLVVSHFVSKNGRDTVVETKAPNEVDESMGLMPIVAPYVERAKARYDELHKQFQVVRELTAQRRPTVFVEGSTDQQIFTRAWDLFSDVPGEAINICVGDSDNDYGSANAVESRALAWLLTVRHKPQGERAKCVAIFDSDVSGDAARKSLAGEIERLNLSSYGLKIMQLRPTPRLVLLARQGFKISVDLEAHYTDDTWRLAESKKWIEPITDRSLLLSKKAIEALVSGGPNPFDGLGDDDRLRLLYKFSAEGKQKAAKRITQMNAAEAQLELAALQPIIADVRSHFNLAVIEGSVGTAMPQVRTAGRNTAKPHK